MLYITEEDALKLWGYIEGETNDLEEQTNKLEEKYQERHGDSQTADSFSIEYWANITANRNAIRELRGEIKTARSDFDTLTGGSVAVVTLSALINSALRTPIISNFQTANLIKNMELDAIRSVLSEVLKYTIKDKAVWEVTA